MSKPLAKQYQVVERLIENLTDSLKLWQYSVEHKEVCSSVVDALQENAQALSDYLQFVGDDLVNATNDEVTVKSLSRLVARDEYDDSDVDFELPNEAESSIL